MSKDLSLIVVSSSLALMATNAMAYVAQNNENLLEFKNSDLDQQIMNKIENAISKKDIREAVMNSFSLFASSFGEDGNKLADKYFTVQFADSSEDFSKNATVPNYNCYSNCYIACYSNCHSSRGWR